MDKLIHKATPNTPYIEFCSMTGCMKIEGRSIPEKADDFWAPIDKWMSLYLMAPCSETRFEIYLDYLNVSSAKHILYLLYRLNTLTENGRRALVVWKYREGDVDMLEVGKDYEHMVRAPFEFVELAEKSLATPRR